MGRTKMKAFLLSALLGLAAADVAHHASTVIGGVASHTGHFAPHHGPAVVSHASHTGHFAPHAVHAPVAHTVHAAPVLSHAVHAPVAHAVHHAPALVAHPVAHAVHHAPAVVAHPVAHAVHAAPVVAHAVHAAPAYHAPVVHTAPAYHAPAPAYKAEVYPDEVSPYTYTYAVSDDYSKASFNAEETSDGAGNAQGSYSVALPDGRIQHVAYTANGYDGYVADVTYDGTAQYPEYVPTAPAYAPAPAYHA